MSAITALDQGSTVVGHYSTPHGPRKLRASARIGHTVLTDEPACRTGPIYTVETMPASDGQDAVTAIVDIYVNEARSTRSIPMAKTILDTDLAVVA